MDSENIITKVASVYPVWISSDGKQCGKFVNFAAIEEVFDHDKTNLATVRFSSGQIQVFKGLQKDELLAELRLIQANKCKILPVEVNEDE